MCGIAGIVSLTERPIDPMAIARLCEQQAHRGPDDAGSVLLSPSDPRRDRRGWELTHQDIARGLPDLQTRGFDGEAAAVERHGYRVALGHRRLAGIDPSLAGHQPMANRERTVWLTYNGEIYNFLELKKELIAKGYAFVSSSDTEV